MSDGRANTEPNPFRLSLPGFVRDEEIGAGQAFKYVTTRLGIRPCGGCERRAATLDKRLVMTPRKK